MLRTFFVFFLYFSCFGISPIQGVPQVTVGIDTLFSTPKFSSLLQNKRIGLITNHTAVNESMHSTIEVLLSQTPKERFKLAAIFSPEHGIDGTFHASEHITHFKHQQNIPIYSLHGKTRRPTSQMLKNIDLLLFDIQDIGCRSYTYISTLFYAMEEAAKHNIPVIVLDRPNPINGIVVDGPMLEDKWRSFVGHVNVPYCYGMTIGELATLFNEEYKVGCRLTVIPMKGWKRSMSFTDTGLPWIPTSPHIPEPSTTFYYPMTGILGELNVVNIGVGYTLPFKVVGAPWIDAKSFASHLNKQQLPGISFHPIHYKPFYGTLAKTDCHGVLIHVTDSLTFNPVTTQYVILGLLKSLYPKPFHEALAKATDRIEMFNKVNGTDKIWKLLKEKPYVAWELRTFDKDKREAFMKIREKHLFAGYD